MPIDYIWPKMITYKMDFKQKPMLLKKLLLSFLILVFGFALIYPSTTHAQQWWNPTYTEFVNKVEGVNGQPPANEIFGERYTHAQVNWIINSLINIVAGRIASCASAPDPSQCLQTLLQGNNIQNPGPVLAMAALIDSFKNTRPASGVDYVAQKLDSFELIPEAYAQSLAGYGFSKTLLPIQSLWGASRNAAYALSSLVVIALAFMIMFRTKISPQAVLTVQSALPKIVIALLLITFSYAISGFIIDLGFLLLGIISALITSAGIGNVNAIVVFQRLNQGVESVLGYGIAFILEAFSGGGIVVRLLNSDNLFFDPASFIRGLDVIIAFVVVLLLIIALIRIFWLLLRSYTVFIFTVIASPFIILLGTLRPASGGASAWIKILVSQTAVFVSVSLLILLSHILFYSFGNASYLVNTPLEPLRNLVNPFGIQPLTGLPDDAGRFPGGFSFSGVPALGFFVSLAVMLSIPKIASSIRDYLQTGRAVFGTSLGEMLGGPIGSTGIGLGGLGASYLVGKRLAAEEAALGAASEGGVDALAAAQGRVQKLKFTQDLISNLRRRKF